MCTIMREKPEIQTATEDIEVYKYVKVVFKPNWITKLFFKKEAIVRSLQSDTPITYHLGRIYETKLDVPFKNYDRWMWKKENSSRYISGSAFYSYKCRGKANAMFIIPKGAKYYIGRDIYHHAVVYHSNQIKFVKLL